jgi:dTDP-4-dehydrorhamnose reductase
MRVLVTGAAGQLGLDTAAACRRAGDDVLAVARADVDVADRAAVMGLVTSWRPDAVIHCAAHTGVDACETEEETAYAVNALAVRWMAQACDAVEAHLVTISTDYVFDGTKAGPYHEWDEPSPRSVYGATKRAGEREALAFGSAATIVRTSWVCGAHGSNMVKTVLRLLAGDGPLRFVDDQRGHPTFTGDLAPVLRALAVERRSGLHHVTNQGEVSWFEFVQCVVAAAGGDVGRVEAIATADLHPPRPAPRPANSVLDNAVLRMSGWPLLPDFRESLAGVVASLV